MARGDRHGDREPKKKPKIAETEGNRAHFDARVPALRSALALVFPTMTVMPLFCAKYLRSHPEHSSAEAAGSADSFCPVNLSFGARFNLWFNHHFEALLTRYDHWVKKTLERPVFSLTVLLGLCAALMLASPLLGVAYFPRTDPGQFVVNVKAPTGTRLEDTARDIKNVEAVIRRIVDPADLDVIASNIGGPEIAVINLPRFAPICSARPNRWRP